MRRDDSVHHYTLPLPAARQTTETLLFSIYVSWVSRAQSSLRKQKKQKEKNNFPKFQNSLWKNTPARKYGKRRLMPRLSRRRNHPPARGLTEMRWCASTIIHGPLLLITTCGRRKHDRKWFSNSKRGRKRLKPPQFTAIYSKTQTFFYELLHTAKLYAPTTYNHMEKRIRTAMRRRHWSQSFTCLPENWSRSF